MTGLTVTELHTQDGYDWPNGCSDERWPADKHQPAAPYFREQLEDAPMRPLPKPRQLSVRAHAAEGLAQALDAEVLAAVDRAYP